MDNDLERALKTINEQDIINFLQAMIQIPSESGEEHNISTFVEEQMSTTSMRINNIGGNIICQLGSGSPILVLNAHLDTVPPGDRTKWSTDPYSGEVVDGRIYGRGSADNKGGLASILMAAKSIHDAGIRLNGTLLVVASIMEEVGKRKVNERKGIVEVLDKKILEGANSAIIAESTNLGISLGHRSPNNFEILVHGKRAHSAMPNQGVNAIENAATIILALQNQKLPEHEILGKGTQSVTLISAGERPNVVPELCTITIDRRLTVGETPTTAVNEYEQLITELEEMNPDLKAEVNCTYGSLPTFTPVETPIVKTLQKSFRQITNQEPTITHSHFGTDGGFIFHHLNIPVIIFGPGEETMAHKSDEYIEITQLIEATKVYIATVLSFFGNNDHSK